MGVFKDRVRRKTTKYDIVHVNNSINEIQLVSCLLNDKMEVGLLNVVPDTLGK